MSQAMAGIVTSPNIPRRPGIVAIAITTAIAMSIAPFSTGLRLRLAKVSGCRSLIA